MYGKHFSSMYERSMVGKGAMVFAVMGYVIATSKPDKNVGGRVILNPDVLGPILGEKPSDVEKAIRFLCAPDLKSESKAEGGRRLVQIGEYDYRVVNFQKYRAMRNEEDRREQNRINQARFRSRTLGKPAKNAGQPLPGEVAYESALNSGNDAEAERILDNQPGIPQEAIKEGFENDK